MKDLTRAELCSIKEFPEIKAGLSPRSGSVRNAEIAVTGDIWEPCGDGTDTAVIDERDGVEGRAMDCFDIITSGVATMSISIHDVYICIILALIKS